MVYIQGKFREDINYDQRRQRFSLNSPYPYPIDIEYGLGTKFFSYRGAAHVRNIMNISTEINMGKCFTLMCLNPRPTFQSNACQAEANVTLLCVSTQNQCSQANVLSPIQVLICIVNPIPRHTSWISSERGLHLRLKHFLRVVLQKSDTFDFKRTHICVRINVYGQMCSPLYY